VRDVVLSIPDLCARRVPDLDVKSGARMTGRTQVEVFAVPRWASRVLPLGPLSSALLRATGRRGVRIELPVARRTTRRRRVAEVVAGAAVIAGVVALASALVRGEGSLGAAGAVLVLIGVLVATAALSRLWVRGRLEGDGVHLWGVHRAFADGVAFVRHVGRPSPEGDLAPLVGTSLPSA
jgi:hypothetical protein